MVDSDDHEKALTLQRPVYERFMGPYRPWQQMLDHYLTGTAADMADRIRRLEKLGVNYMILHPIVNDPEQLDMLKEKVVSRFRRG